MKEREAKMTAHRPLRMGIAGATGMVGRELLELLEARDFPIQQIRLFASRNSAGGHVFFRDRELVVEDLAEARAGELDLVFFSAGGAVAREHAPRFAEAGAFVIDNSSAFRDDEAVPLIVPEVNGALLERSPSRLIANPNCSTIILLLPLAPLHRELGLEEVVVSTYQAVSGAGKRAMDDLIGQAHAYAQGEEEIARFFDRPIFLNLIPRIGDWTPEGDCLEERKMVRETARILGDSGFAVYATTVRVPVERCHCESVFVRLGRPASREQVTELLRASPGVVVNELPTPRELARREEVFVGRIRVAPADGRVVRFWVVSDQLWKGAALNAIQIAERLLASGRFDG